MSEAVLYLYAETPVHAGADTGSGVIDQPIQRETSTGHPVIWGQSLKGALRERAHGYFPDQRVQELFGTALTSPDEKESGAISIGDAQVVAFPVPTMVNTFAWATSGLALGTLARKRRRAFPAENEKSPAAPAPGRDAAYRTRSAPWRSDAEIFGLSTTTIRPDESVSAWADLLATEALPEDEVFLPFRDKLKRDFVVLDETDYSDNVRHGTEVTPRIALEAETKRVKSGAYFYVEYLPVETILAATITFTSDKDRDDFAKMFATEEPPLQLGGGESIGKGLLWGRLAGGGLS